MSIILIGFMGIGKSAVGKKLANKLNMKFIDMDSEIERRERNTIKEIFKEHGQEYFRILEGKLLTELCSINNIIVATGGGIVTQENNCKILENKKTVVFLDGSVETIIEHISNEVNKRPLLKDSEDLPMDISNLLSERYDAYKKASDVIINVDNKNVDEVVSELLVYIV